MSDIRFGACQELNAGGATFREENTPMTTQQLKERLAAELCDRLPLILDNKDGFIENIILATLDEFEREMEKEISIAKRAMIIAQRSDNDRLKTIQKLCEEHNEWRRRALDAERRIANALA